MIRLLLQHHLVSLLAQLGANTGLRRREAVMLHYDHGSGFRRIEANGEQCHQPATRNPAGSVVSDRMRYTPGA